MKRCDDCIHDSVCAQTWRMADGCSYYEEPRPHGEWTKESAIDYLTEIGWLPEHDRILTDRPHGEWLSHYEYCKKHDCIPSGLIAFWWCNKCEQGVEIQTNFCPNCGADMQANDRQVTGKLNSKIAKSKSEIVPDYRDGWRKSGEVE